MPPSPRPRPSGRGTDELREIRIETGVSKHAEGSCLVSFGDTRVLCTASVEDGVPPFLRGRGAGWVTAEYGMLPRATSTRTVREASRGRVTGRTQEIQRLIGRSLRAVVDTDALGERTVRIDCDVLQADGGTRTAAITGAWVALRDALAGLEGAPGGPRPLAGQVAAVSAGLWRGTPILDLDYAEDLRAEADANFVFAADGGIVEVQATAEDVPFAPEAFDALMALARKGVGELLALQDAAVPG